MYPKSDLLTRRSAWLNFEQVANIFQASLSWQGVPIKRCACLGTVNYCFPPKFWNDIFFCFYMLLVGKNIGDDALSVIGDRVHSNVSQWCAIHFALRGIIYVHQFIRWIHTTPVHHHQRNNSNFIPKKNIGSLPVHALEYMYAYALWNIHDSEEVLMHILWYTIIYIVTSGVCLCT